MKYRILLILPVLFLLILILIVSNQPVKKFEVYKLESFDFVTVKPELVLRMWRPDRTFLNLLSDIYDSENFYSIKRIKSILYKTESFCGTEITGNKIEELFTGDFTMIIDPYFMFICAIDKTPLIIREFKQKNPHLISEKIYRGLKIYSFKIDDLNTEVFYTLFGNFFVLSDNISVLKKSLYRKTLKEFSKLKNKSFLKFKKMGLELLISGDIGEKLDFSILGQSQILAKYKRTTKPYDVADFIPDDFRIAYFQSGPLDSIISPVDLGYNLNSLQKQGNLFVLLNIFSKFLFFPDIPQNKNMSRNIKNFISSDSDFFLLMDLPKILKDVNDYKKYNKLDFPEDLANKFCYYSFIHLNLKIAGKEFSGNLAALNNPNL